MLIQPVLRPVLQPVLRSIFDPGIGGGGTPSLTAQVQALFPKYSAAGGMWDFTDMATLFQDSDRTVPVTSASQPVGGVNDISGSHSVLVQHTSAYRPIYNGAEITFDGVDDSLSTFTMTLGAPSGVSYFLRARFAELTGWREMLFYGTTGDGGNWASGRNQIQIHRTPAGGIEVSAAGPTTTARWLRISAGLSHDISVSAVFDYATASSSVTGVGDGVLLPSSLIQMGNLNGTVLDSVLRIGLVQGSHPFVGAYKRLLFIGAALSPEDAAIVTAWLAEVA